MIAEKQKLINAQGVSVTIYDRLLDTQESYAIIGRASTQFNSMISLEAHRRGMFLNSVEIQSGYIVKNNVTEESYLSVATYKEVIDNQLAAIFSHMCICNSNLTVTRQVKTYDSGGQSTVQILSIVNNVDCYIESKKQSLKEHEAGVDSDNTYLVFSPAFELETKDTFTITTGGITLKLKVESLDYISYKGIVVISACIESRK